MVENLFSKHKKATLEYFQSYPNHKTAIQLCRFHFYETNARKYASLGELEKAAETYISRIDKITHI